MLLPPQRTVASWLKAALDDSEVRFLIRGGCKKSPQACDPQARITNVGK
jgi:hypothetical protein